MFFLQRADQTVERVKRIQSPQEFSGDEANRGWRDMADRFSSLS